MIKSYYKIQFFLQTHLFFTFRVNCKNQKIWGQASRHGVTMTRSFADYYKGATPRGYPIFLQISNLLLNFLFPLDNAKITD